MTFLRKLAKAEGLEPEATASLYELVKMLVLHALPGLKMGDLAAILSQRSLKSGEPGASDLPADMLEELCPGDLDNRGRAVDLVLSL